MNRIGVALLTFCMMTCTFMGLANIIQTGGWQWHMIGLNLFIGAGMYAMVLLVKNHKIMQSIASIGVGLVIWVCYMTGITDGGVVPTPRALSILFTHLSDAVMALPNYGRPASNAALFLPLGIVGLGPMCVVAYFLAVNLKSPISAGIPALGCWVVFLSGGPSRGLGWAIISVASYLLLLGVSDKKGKPGRFQAVAVPVLALSAVVGVVASYVLPLAPTWGRSEDLLDFWNDTYTDNTGINVDGPIRVADSLRSQSAVVLFHTQGEIEEPLKMGTLDSFTGQSWVASNRGRARTYQEGTIVWYQWGGSTNSPGTIQYQTTPGDGWVDGANVSVKIDQLSGIVVPAGDGPRSITDVDGFILTYDAGSDTFRSRANVLEEGDSYVTHTMVLDHSSLRGIRAPTRNSLLDPDLIEHAGEITELTAGVIGSAVTEDEMLNAIQAYLTGPGFLYTLTPTWESHGDPVWDFLQAKQGYCVHYATAMAVMAMSVGIPMHVSVGYLPGTQEEDDWRVVTGGRAHMWPEAYFAGVGWVRYEPTPAIQIDVGMVGPFEEPTEEFTEGEVPLGEQNQETLPETTTAPTEGPQGSGAGAINWVLVSEIGGGVVGGVLVVVLAWLAYIRLYSPEKAWRAILRAGMNKGLLTDAMSVRTAVGVLTRHLGPTCAPDLADLQAHLEVSRYAPPDADPAKIDGSTLWKLKRSVTRELRT